MEKQSDNDFKLKFKLLYSQQNTDEIVWSCSDSSDYENNIQQGNLESINKTINRKRKRGKAKKLRSKNVSNLDITIVDAPSENKNEHIPYKKSPILQKLKPNRSTNLTHSHQSFGCINHKNITGSPILTFNSRNCNHIEMKTHKSPILHSNHASPKISPNVRKKLFSNINDKEIYCTSKKIERSDPPVFNCSQISKFSSNKSIEHERNDNKPHLSRKPNREARLNEFQILKDDLQINDTQEDNNLDNTLATKTDVELIGKVKTYFDSHFSSETQSQQSISEYDTTPKDSSKTSEEIELINTPNDPLPVPIVIKLEKESSSDSLRSFENDKSKKKVKYKKGGLAYRLNELLKKQKANISLWQHERFLAANSNFVLPNEDFTAFHIQNITFKYGCYLLEIVDLVGKKYIAIINNLNVNNIFLEQFTNFKLYRPYGIVAFNKDYQIIVNISKFECN